MGGAVREEVTFKHRDLVPVCWALEIDQVLIQGKDVGLGPSQVAWRELMWRGGWGLGVSVWWSSQRKPAAPQQFLTLWGSRLARWLGL